MAYILTPRFTTSYQAPQCNPFGFCAPSSRPAYSYRTVQYPQSQPQSRSSPFASFFSQLDELVSEIDRESQRQAQIEARAEALRAAQIEAQREAYKAQIEAQREAYRQRQAQIAAHVEAQREAHRQRQLRKRVLRANFAVTQNEQGWQISAEVPGFEQENINIEVTDENTLQITGNTEWGVKSQTEAQSEAKIAPEIDQSADEATEKTIEQTVEQKEDEKTDAIVLDKTDVEPAIATESATNSATETESSRPATPDSDTASQKSYQPTVEDDFEDLGPEASSLFSIPSQSTTPAEPKGKERAVEPPSEHHETVEDPEVSIPETAVTQQSQSQVPTQEHQQEEHQHSSFERIYRFPERIDASNVRAILKDGVLSISIPRVQVQQVRRIAIL